MAISDVLAAIEQAYNGDVLFRDGIEHLSENSSPPRIVWCGTDERIEPANPHWVGPPRCLHLRRVTIEAHLWAATRSGVENLLQSLVWAINLAVGKSYQLSMVRWPQGPEKLVQLGMVAILPVTFLIPLNVPDGVEGEATITTTDTTDTALPFGIPPPFGE
jgi:hypothetical protein